MKNIARLLPFLFSFVFITSTAFGQVAETKESLVSINDSAVPRSLTPLAAKPYYVPSIPAKRRAAPSSTFTWEGAYVGGHLGYGWGKGDTTFDPLPDPATFMNMRPTAISSDPRGFVGGGQGGYNWQSGHFVAGFEGSLAFTKIEGTETVTPIVQNNGSNFPGPAFQSTSQDIKYLGTLRGRAGAAFGRVFIYGTGGLAFGKVNYAAESDFRNFGTRHYPASFSKTKAGFTFGGGAEIAINEHWSFKGEYLYFDLRKETATVDAQPTPLPPFQVRYTWETKAGAFTGGFNYRW